MTFIDLFFAALIGVCFLAIIVCTHMLANEAGYQYAMKHEKPLPTKLAQRPLYVHPDAGIVAELRVAQQEILQLKGIVRDMLELVDAAQAKLLAVDRRRAAYLRQLKNSRERLRRIREQVPEIGHMRALGRLRLA